MNLLLLGAGYPVAVIPVGQRAEYLDALVFAQAGGDGSRLLGLAMDAVESSLRDWLGVLATATEAQASERPFYGEMLAYLGPSA